MSDNWNPRLDLVEALEAEGWTGDADNPLGLLRKNGAVVAVLGSGDTALSGPAHWTTSFPSDAPDDVILAACRAAALLELSTGGAR